MAGPFFTSHQRPGVSPAINARALHWRPTARLTAKASSNPRRIAYDRTPLSSYNLPNPDFPFRVGHASAHPDCSDRGSRDFRSHHGADHLVPAAHLPAIHSAQSANVGTDA